MKSVEVGRQIIGIFEMYQNVQFPSPNASRMFRLRENVR